LFIVEALRRCSTELTRAGLHRALRAYRGRLADLDLDFTSGSATGARYVDLVYAKTDGTYVR